jgi:hypothetical protein
MIQYGKHSPIHLKCIDKQITLHDMNISKKDIELVELLFVDINHDQYTEEERQRLCKLDAYIDIPMIEAVLDPFASYNSFNRLITNESQVPNKYWNNPGLVLDAIKHGSLMTFKAAYAMHSPYRENILRSIVEYHRIDMLEYMEPFDQEELHVIINSTSKYGHVDIWDYLKQKGYQLHINLNWIIGFGHVQCFEYVRIHWPYRQYTWRQWVMNNLDELVRLKHVQCLLYLAENSISAKP